MHKNRTLAIINIYYLDKMRLFIRYFLCRMIAIIFVGMLCVKNYSRRKTFIYWLNFYLDVKPENEIYRRNFYIYE